MKELNTAGDDNGFTIHCINQQGIATAISTFSNLFDVKGEFYKGERIYMVHHSNFYHALRTNLELLKDFLYRMCIALSLFARISIVHGDLKPDNIIIDYDE